MIEQVCAVVCSVFSVAYSGYFLAHLTGHFTRGWRQACPLGSRAGSAPPLAPSLVEEEAEEEQEHIKPPAAVPPRPQKAPAAAGTGSGSPAQPAETREEQRLMRLRSVVSPGEPRSKYTALEELGRGGFGAVYRALDASTGKQVAIKKMTLQEEDCEELAVNEIVAMRDNRNPNIVTYLDRLGCWHVSVPSDSARQK
ncbi:serine/threonine-protein kinase PAK 3-like [Cyanistes caeruleus]|uniref:serine/threonine-protein kinase PAK 3-like n=1 Tax=Cyanistes caeruleus TaxID=156563 RepID=UPI000CDA69C9|nr:serine/threonine-protein kinase PAK 3-like [Cyanistes caeruleus]